MDYREVEEIINYFSNRLKADAVQVNQIILFGSQSNGSANSESDIDLCVISRDFEGKGILQRAKMIRNAEIATIKKYLIPLDVINMTPEELAKGASLAAQFVSNGNVIYEAL
ncbi:MAG: nucleotidyltransferase domain-containing protein [Firmicutes bacterium]|nr:nucleotidyltransferase domain-containing protein [Bacillota bacterium]